MFGNDKHGPFNQSHQLIKMIINLCILTSQNNKKMDVNENLCLLVIQAIFQHCKKN